MFKHLSILGLGPHRDFQASFTPSGLTVLRGASEVGKSFVLEALLLVLWGQSSSGTFQPAAIHDGFSKAVVELTLDDGRILRRSITRTRSMTRIILSGDHRETYPNEADFRKAIGPLGDSAETLRQVLVPMAWKPLIAGNARKFRDLLGRILPKGDVAAEIRRRMSGHAVSETECGWTDKDATQYRREARKRRDHAEGRRSASEERVASLEAREVQVPPPMDRSVLDAADAWDQFERAAAGQATSLALQGEWDRQHSALGTAPEPHPEAQSSAATTDNARRNATAATQAYQEVYGRYQTAMAHQQTFGALADPSTCPMCQRPGWEQGAEMATQAQAAVMDLQGAFMAAQQVHQQAHATLKDAETTFEAVRAAKAKITSWERSRTAMGSRPEVTGVTDVAPSLPRPSAEDITVAREQERVAIAQGGAHARWIEELAEAKRQAKLAMTAHADASAEATRADALVDAIRSAPSAIAAQQAEALGDLGPVSLAFGENPAVAVHIDGRPFWLASRGRQVVADIWLRAGIRRVTEVPELPLAVDNIQDVGGQPVPRACPALHMRTTDDPELHVDTYAPDEDEPS